MRTEFGSPRTTCSCEVCTNNCRHMPGFLIPADLDRMIPSNMEPLPWAEMALRASPGALVMNSATGALFRIPTLVPKKVEAGCVFLLDTPQGQSCAIHEISPFGCAFFDCSPRSANTDHLTHEGILAVAQAWHQASLYQRIWHHLFDKGLTAQSPEENRRQMAGQSLNSAGGREI
jgi:hypothetical protein